jgi:hypothetical protein
MEEIILNGELALCRPDGFEAMTAEEIRQAYGMDEKDKWAMVDKDRHMVVSVFWHVSGGFLSKLGDAGTVCKSTERTLSKEMRNNDYKLIGFQDRTICGMEAKGFRHDYSINGIAYVSDVNVVKKGTACYTVYAYTRKECETENRPVLDDILDGMRFKDDPSSSS